MSGLIAPFPKHQFLANDGSVAAAYQLFSYAAGTATKLDTYTDAGLLTANANPIILDASGRATIFLNAALSYKFVLATPTDTDPPLSPIWTVDGVQSTSLFAANVDITGTLGEQVDDEGTVVYLADETGVLSTVGGRWYKTDGDVSAKSTLARAIGLCTSTEKILGTVTIRIVGRVTGLTGLSAGTVYYASGTAGTLTATPPTHARQIGVADSTTSLVLSHNLRPVDQIWIDTTTVGNVGAGEDDLMTYDLAIPALDRNGRGVSIEAWGHTANNANAKTIKLYFGSTQILVHVAAISEAGSWYIKGQVVRTGAATQNAVAFSESAPTAGGDVTASAAIATQPTEALSAAVTIKVTGEATTTNDITQEGMIIRYT